ncbi:MAG: hypothetical protein V3V54_04705, partial [Candidatus Brocadiales bacterium]
NISRTFGAHSAGISAGVSAARLGPSAVACLGAVGLPAGRWLLSSGGYIQGRKNMKYESIAREPKASPIIECLSIFYLRLHATR